MKSLVYMDLTIGADPELFFSKNGRIIGSERILQGGKLEKNPAYGLGPVEVVEDGVQAELHPRPFACRANFSDSLKLTFQCLDEALQKLGEEHFDLVLADIFLPGRNGYEVCEFVKRHPEMEGVPVILLVGAFEPFDKAEAARVQADGHLTKPFESRILI